MLPLLKFIRKIGQGQLLRRQLSIALKFGCQLDAQLLYESLDTFNVSLLSDVVQSYHRSGNSTQPVTETTNNLLYETTALLEACGLDDPLSKIYVTTQPLEGLPVLLFLFLLTYLPKVSLPHLLVMIGTILAVTKLLLLTARI